MKKTLLYLFFLSIANVAIYSQKYLTQDSLLEQQIYESGLIHQPLPLNTHNSFEGISINKDVVKSTPLQKTSNLDNWSHSGAGSMSFNTEKSISRKGSIKLQFPTYTGNRAIGSPADPDYATYGNSSITYHLNGINLEEYNRLIFSIYPDCEGARIVNMNLTFQNAETPAKKGYNVPSGSHLINLENKKWNQCFLEIDEYQRDKVLSITFSATLKGQDRTMGDSAIYYIDNFEIQQIKNPEKVYGWVPDHEKISYSTTGYAMNYPKTAIISTDASARAHKNFQLLNQEGQSVYEGNIQEELTSIGQFGILDFSSFNFPGYYRLKVGNIETKPFQIGERLWENSQWKVLNFIFCQRCGYSVPSIHSTCHVDLMSQHNGSQISYSGGWHDAGDLSQQTLQTGDVTFALLEAYNKHRTNNPVLAARLREEAEWGLEFILKNRYKDGYRASSMGLLIWQDGIFKTWDDISSVRVQNMAFDNFLYAGYEAYASMTLDNDPMLQEHLRRIAEEDFAFAMRKFKKDGFDKFIQPYEHTYNTPKSQYMATISWSASQLYKLTKKKYYAEVAAESIQYTLDCQRTKPIENKEETRGFFYRDKSRKSIVHYIHQSREQIYMQALSILCETQNDHSEYKRWENAIQLYGDYLKGIMKYTYPYGMIPSGVYHTEEYKDTANFYALHLFPPTNAAELYTKQIQWGVQLDREHYIKRFPVWFNIFNGNTAVHLSNGKSAAICGKFLNDKELLNIGLEQLYWVVGKNPFGQSLIYGEGYHYPQMNSFSSGEMVGEIPVGIRTLGNEDIPYWPQTNNACYKEVWVTSAGKWLSLSTEY